MGALSNRLSEIRNKNAAIKAESVDSDAVFAAVEARDFSELRRLAQLLPNTTPNSTAKRDSQAWMTSATRGWSEKAPSWASDIEKLIAHGKVHLAIVRPLLAR